MVEGRKHGESAGPWAEDAFSLPFPTGVVASDWELAETVYRCACRTDFSAPGFCLMQTDCSTSESLRASMIALWRGLDALLRSRRGQSITILSAGRFDQQVTTRPHRDGAPDESLLVLGYEPSEVVSEVSLLDYSACAHRMGITPAEFLERHNPMFAAGEELLTPDKTTLRGFSIRSWQILVVNNSSAAFDPEDGRWQGVLHTATIPNPSESTRRVVNSMMLASVPIGSASVVGEEEIAAFLTTRLVRRRGYDRPDRTDDQ